MPSWHPTATLETLRARAAMLAHIRQFFAERDVLEVETPLLSSSTVTDPHVVGIPAIFKNSSQEKMLYLQTSPEYAMKRLLAAGYGSIYQLGKAFRQGDLGKKHNPEFTMLEWYRIGFDHHALMDEMDDFLKKILETSSAERISYQDLFEKQLGCDPHTAPIEELEKIAKQKINFKSALSARHAWLDLLFTHCIEPLVGQEKPIFIYDFPVSLAALARIRPENPPVASRFEVYFRGIELANGFHELEDAKEQRQRFVADLQQREQLQLPPVAIDEYFLAALQHGFPSCAGVALGVDRLMMLKLKHQTIAEVMSFGFES